MSLSLSLVASLSLLGFLETFDDAWATRWVQSDWTGGLNQSGPWERRSGGLATAADAHFYALSARLPTVVATRSSDLFVQYTVAHPQALDCGGGYLKLFPSSVDQAHLHGGADEDAYRLMFGPDICGGDKKTHLIFEYQGRTVERRERMACKSDTAAHLYGLALHANGSYAVRLDDETLAAGTLADDWPFLAPPTIPDPNASKPADWVDEPTVADPAEAKPEGWDDVPAEVADPAATKPADWDESDDGEWEPPLVANPEYKGEWVARRIANPAYQGEWAHPHVPNPAYAPDDSMGRYDDIGVVGFELWQVKSGTVFDDVLVSTSAAEAAAHAAEVLERLEAEAKAAKEAEAVRAAEEAEAAKEAEEAEAAKEAEEEHAKEEL